MAFSLLSLLLFTSLGACTAPKKAVFPFDAPMVDKEDKSTSLESLRGRPLVVVAYAASMPDCRRRIEKFVELSEAFGNREVTFVAIDISPIEAKQFPDVVSVRAGNALFVKDVEGAAGRALKVDLIPTTFFVSRKGEILEKVEAVHSWDGGDFRNRVEKFLENS